VVRDFGIEDRWPVPCEPFTQWILEDHFPAGRPDLSAVGVQFVHDVKPYELMKLRLLNASHQALAYLGGPQGYRLVDEAMNDASIVAFLEAYMHDEARPTLQTLPGIDVDSYIDMIIQRFSNPQIMDTIVRLATDGTNRMATFVLPVIAENLKAGRPIEFGSTIVAAWAQYWAAIERGEIEFIPEDRFAPVLRRLAIDENLEAFSADRTLVGDLADNATFHECVARQRQRLMGQGMGHTVAAALDTRASRPSTASRSGQ
jgi:mannitol 2-dehydrogenase